jgi:hypothetical protein
MYVEVAVGLDQLEDRQHWAVLAHLIHSVFHRIVHSVLVTIVPDPMRDCSGFNFALLCVLLNPLREPDASQTLL